MGDSLVIRFRNLADQYSSALFTDETESLSGRVSDQRIRAFQDIRESRASQRRLRTNTRFNSEQRLRNAIETSAALVGCYAAPASTASWVSSATDFTSSFRIRLVR